MNRNGCSRSAGIRTQGLFQQISLRERQGLNIRECALILSIRWVAQDHALTTPSLPYKQEASDVSRCGNRCIFLSQFCAPHKQCAQTECRSVVLAHLLEPQRPSAHAPLARASQGSRGPSSQEFAKACIEVELYLVRYQVRDLDEADLVFS